jgi:hypothetical protein
MMDWCAGRGQGLARGGVFGELFDSDHLLTAWADTTSAQALAGS